MRFCTQQHQFYCGIDLHARLLAVCIVDEAGSVVLRRPIPDDPQQLRELLAPCRPDVVIAEPEAELRHARDQRHRGNCRSSQATGTLSPRGSPASWFPTSLALMARRHGNRDYHDDE